MAFGDVLAGWEQAAHEHHVNLLQMEYQSRNEAAKVYSQMANNPAFLPEQRAWFAKGALAHLNYPEKVPAEYKYDPEKPEIKIPVQAPTTPPPQQEQPGALPQGTPGVPLGQPAPNVPPPQPPPGMTSPEMRSPFQPKSAEEEAMLQRPLHDEAVRAAVEQATGIAKAQALIKPPADIQPFGEGRTGLYNKLTGEVVLPPHPPNSKFEQKVGTVDDKPVVVNYDPATGKTYDLKGVDVSDKFKPKESIHEPTFEEQTYEDWHKENPKGTRKEFAEWKSKLAPTASFNINNPVEPQENVNYIAEQIENDPTGLMFARLVGQNKRLRDQVTTELRSRDSDLRVLTPATRQLGETAHELMPNFAEALKLLDSKTLQNKMSTVVGPRWQEFLAGTVGKGDSEIDRLRTFVSLLQTGTMRAHVGARGSGALQSKFENLFNSTKMDAPTLKDTLTATRDFLKTYENAAYKNKGGSVNPGEKTATNPTTGEVLVLRNGQWVKP